MKERWTSIDGIRTRYLESKNNGKKRHVLFIHGLGSSADRWLDIPLALSSYFHTIAVDLPGFGQSDKPKNIKYTIKEFADFIARFMQEIKIDDGKTSIVGHSLGGYIACEVAIQKHPVDKLVLIDTSGMLDGPTPLLKKYLAAAMNPNRQSVRNVFERLVADPIRIPDWLVDGFIFRLSQPGAKEAFRLAYENSVNTQISTSRLKRLGNIRTLIIWGKEDRLIPAKYSKIFSKAIKSSQVTVIDDAGHAPFAEKPAVVCEILHQFLALRKFGKGDPAAILTYLKEKSPNPDFADAVEKASKGLRKNLKLERLEL